MPRPILSPLLLATLSIAGQSALAQDQEAFTLSGSVAGWAQVGGDDPTALVPDPAAQGYRAKRARADLTLTPKWNRGPVSAQAQARIGTQTGSEEQVEIDEAFLRYEMSETLFLTVGRRNLSYGQSYGLNPADLFRLPLAEPDVYPTDTARSMAGSADLVQLEWLFPSGGALQFVLSEDDPAGGKDPFAMARLSGMALDSKLDYAVSGFGGARPGVGLSMTYGLGESSVLYFDATWRRGRDRAVVTGMGADGSLLLAPSDDDAWRGFATLGVGHTFGNGMTLNAEFSHDANGLSDGEWADTGAVIEAITPVSSPAQGQALGALNGALNHYTQRRNYAFLRLAQESVAGSAFSTEMTVLHGLEDSSGIIGLRLEHPLGETARVGLAVTQTYGGEGDEFRMRPDRSSVALYTMVTF